MHISTLRNVVPASFFGALAHAVPASVQSEVNDSIIPSSPRSNVAQRSVTGIAKIDVLEAIASTFDFLKAPDAMFKAGGRSVFMDGGIGLVGGEWAIVDGAIAQRRYKIHHGSHKYRH